MQAVARLFILGELNRVKAHGWSSLPTNDGEAIDKRACNEPHQDIVRKLEGE